MWETTTVGYAVSIILDATLTLQALRMSTYVGARLFRIDYTAWP